MFFRRRGINGVYVCLRLRRIQYVSLSTTPYPVSTGYTFIYGYAVLKYIPLGTIPSHQILNDVFALKIVFRDCYGA